MKRKYKKELSTKELAALPDSAIDASEIPELDEAFWTNAKVVMPRSREKTQITAKFDADVVDWFKKGGRGYQTRMNAVLRTYFEATSTQNKLPTETARDKTSAPKSRPGRRGSDRVA